MTSRRILPVRYYFVADDTSTWGGGGSGLDEGHRYPVTGETVTDHTAENCDMNRNMRPTADCLRLFEDTILCFAREITI